MACEFDREALSDVAAGLPVPPGTEEHLSSCVECREEVESLRRGLAAAERAMADLLAEGPSAALAVRIRQAVSEPVATVWGRGGLPKTVAATAALVAAVVLLVVQVRGPQPERPRALPATSNDPRTAASRPPSGPAADNTPGFAVPPPPSETRPTPGPAMSTRMPLRVEEHRPAVGGVEILVPPGEVDAVLRFAADLQTRRVPPDSLLVRDQSSALPEPEAVDIAPLDIVPLDPTETSGTD